MLEEITCPICRALMQQEYGCIKPAKCYDDCLRKCYGCQLGASNTQKNPTFIYRNFLDAIPIQVREGLEDVLDNALNVANRATKKRRIAYSSSEDAATWVFFSYFVIYRKLDVLQQLLGLSESIVEILLWGCPLIEKEDKSYTSLLISTCTSLNEYDTFFTEPDCVIILAKSVVFIEVKRSSMHAIESDASKFERYYDARYYIDYQSAIHSRLYELVRNWTIGSTFANPHSFTLIYLGPEKLFSHQSNSIELFSSSLSDPSHFLQKSWQSVLADPRFMKMDSWFLDDIIRRLGFMDSLNSWNLE